MNAHDRIQAPHFRACLDHAVHTVLHFWIAALHRFEIQLHFLRTVRHTRRTTAADAQQAIAAAEKQYKRYAIDVPFRYKFLDKSFEAQYKSDQRAGTLFNVFAGIAIFISCLGLFGLATYMAENRTKEIGIKKVFGSSEQSIVYSFLRWNFILVSLAALLSVPITLHFMIKWLDKFSFKVDINWWVFVIAYIFAAIVVLLTVFFHSYKASRINPVKALRHE